MELFSTVTAELNVEQLTELIKIAAQRETGRVVDNVEFLTSTRCTGYGQAERVEQVFTGAKITFGRQVAKGTPHSDDFVRAR